ncbi:hypothetical protein Moror_7491 [Moniliophthora roreri MCA 2997]|uniref:Uncharacterized protein n=1 Tax=Moniliophthora roreri (strain MCA 2997) TaxID=1381753 RepID=V2WUU5_MONRO|nr:hypothetical protein Moror_7491 [Moniliophthora roreri MCA 2997]
MKLKGEENYRAWEYRTRVAAQAANLLEMLMGKDKKPNGGPSSKAVKAWKNRRDAATEMLVKHLEDEVLTHAKGFDEDLAGLWAHLIAIFGESGVGAAVRMWREFLNVKYRGEEMTIVMGWIQSLANDLEQIHNDRPSNTQIVAIMLNSIAEHPDFGNLITNLEFLKEEMEVDNVELRIDHRLWPWWLTQMLFNVRIQSASAWAIQLRSVLEKEERRRGSTWSGISDSEEMTAPQPRLH